MKLFKPKTIPKKIIKLLFWAYSWGFDDATNGIKKKTLDQVDKSVQKGYTNSGKKIHQ